MWRKVKCIGHHVVSNSDIVYCISDIVLFKSVSVVYIIWIYLQIIYVVLQMHNNTPEGIININKQNIPKLLTISVNNFIVKYWFASVHTEDHRSHDLHTTQGTDTMQCFIF